MKSDIKYDTKKHLRLDENGFSGETNMDITPEFTAKLGCSCSAVFDKKTVVACSGNRASLALKAAFCAGLSSSASDALDCGILPLPTLIFTASVVGAGGIVYINAAKNSEIILLNDGGLPLTRVQERKLEAAINRGEYRNAEWNHFGKIRSFRDSALLYSEMLFRTACFSTRYCPELKCNNELIRKAAEPVFSKIANKNGEKLEICINSSGTKVEFRKNGCVTTYDTLLLLVASSMMKNGLDFAVPAQFPSSIEWIAKSLGRNVYRFFRCSNDNGDLKARQIAARELFLNDGLILALNVLEIITREFSTLDEMVSALPKTCVENRFISISCPPQKILGKLIGKNSGVSEGIYLGSDDNRVLLRSNKRGDGIFLFAESMSAETAHDLCADAEKTVMKLLSDEKGLNSAE